MCNTNWKSVQHRRGKTKSSISFLKMKESFSRHLAGQGEMKVVGDDHSFDPSCQTGLLFPAQQQPHPDQWDMMTIPNSFLVNGQSILEFVCFRCRCRREGAANIWLWLHLSMTATRWCWRKAHSVIGWQEIWLVKPVLRSPAQDLKPCSH